MVVQKVWIINGNEMSDGSLSDDFIAPPRRPPRVDVMLPSVQCVPLSHETIEHIIRQKSDYLAYRRERDERIWNDPDFHPGPLLDKISERIALGLIKEATDLLESTCDEFIDCLVQSEFFPDEE
jgi:hypothetical protein